MKKRGLSPVIATVLLVSIALVLAVIIFLWARSNINETIEKENQNIELVCEQVSFVAEAFASEGKLWIENTGNVALWGVEVRIKRTGEISGVHEFVGRNSAGDSTVNPGQTKDIDFSDAGHGETIIVSPILLGKSKENKDSVPHICDIEYGYETIVGP
jgi:flagellin-like protein